MARLSHERQTFPFACSYFHDGANWAITIHAYDWQDAQARCDRLGLTLDGELFAEVSFGPLAKAFCRLANFFKKSR